MEHHAYFAEGSVSDLNRLAVKAAHQLGIKLQGNSDVIVRAHTSFGIDDARDVANLASLAPVHGKKLFVLGVSAVTREAQNALLKLFEEPAPNTFFVLLVPHGTLLPTLRSRCLRLELSREKNANERVQAEHFLRGSYATRSSIIEKLLKDKEREPVREFLNALEEVLYEKKGEGRTAGLADIALMRGYVSDRAPSLKMVLEHLAATLPS